MYRKNVFFEIFFTKWSNLDLDSPPTTIIRPLFFVFDVLIVVSPTLIISSRNARYLYVRFRAIIKVLEIIEAFCHNIFDLFSANTCSWMEGPTNEDDVMQCMDGTLCNGSTDGWDCCKDKGGRGKCPLNKPYMCAKPNDCGGGTDHCCSVTIADCDISDGLRQCDESGDFLQLARRSLKSKVLHKI